jgi:hypothetical protein
MAMVMLLHAINQAALVKSTDNSGNSCKMRVSSLVAGWKSPVGYFPGFVREIDADAKTVLDLAA